MSEGGAALLALGAVVVAVALLAVRFRARRQLARRITDAAVRLDDEPPLFEGRGVERAMAQLERAVERSVSAGGDRSVTEARLARALGAIPQGVVICDEEGEVVFRNDVAAAFFVARHSDALVEAAIVELLRDAVEGIGGTRTLDLYGPPRRTLVIVAVPLDDGRRAAGALIVIDDISDRRRLEAVRRDFVANISHELKTPVGALALLAETLVAEEEASVQRRLSERMLTEAHRVGRTIDDLLELSRIEAQELPERDPVTVHLVVAEAADRIRPAADHRRIIFEIDEPSHRLTVRGDRRQLVSALSNLLENAVKYSDDGSTVQVRAHGDGTWVEIVVQDHGMGIPTRDLERVFERFYRVDRARSRQTGGTGLGLAIVRHVANNHRGEVRVQSREGEGSTFTLRLPAGPGPVALAGNLDAAEQGGAA
ncbi:two-component system sensor histidine kinase SenX3 [soil metagenome]